MFKGILKVVISGIISVIIISIIMCFYSITPIHKNNQKGNTDYVWIPNSFWVRLTEGISWGRFDANGYNNLQVINNPDIIFVGSSHMEAIEVFYNQTACALLNDKLGNKYSIYNLGISGHNFYKTCQYLPKNLELYEDVPKVTIIETSTVDVDSKNVEDILSFKVEKTKSYDEGFIATFQKIPFFRVLYSQVENGLLNVFMGNKANPAINNIVGGKKETLPSDIIDEAAYDKLFKHLSDLENKYKTEFVIFYHPTEGLQKDGNISFEYNQSANVFSKYADKYNIDFIDMTNAFKEMYKNEHCVAHGFATGKLCFGHLNANGHKAVSNELYRVIKDMEQEGRLCK